jgi:hypothetical protein
MGLDRPSRCRELELDDSAQTDTDVSAGRVSEMDVNNFLKAFPSVLGRSDVPTEIDRTPRVSYGHVREAVSRYAGFRKFGPLQEGRDLAIASNGSDLDLSVTTDHESTSRGFSGRSRNPVPLCAGCCPLCVRTTSKKIPSRTSLCQLNGHNSWH